VSPHPLAVLLTAAAHGRFPACDGLVEVLPSPGPPCDALVAFTGHHVLAADVDATEIDARWPAGELTVPFSPKSLVWLEGRLGSTSYTHDALLVSIADGGGAPSWLRPAADLSHARVDEAAHFRTIESVWTDDVGSVLLVGRGLCGRWEVGYEVEPGHRGAGLGRRLVGAARGLVPAGEPLWAQVAPGNVASMRSTLAAGFVPVGAEMLFVPNH
jgi:hypothetical protein